MDKSLKRQIVEAAEAVKKKVRSMRDIEMNNKQALETVFKPVTDSLNLLNNSSNQSILSHNTGNEETDVRFANQTLQKEESSQSNYDNSDESDIDSDASYQSFVDNNQERDTSSWSLSSEALTEVPYGVRRERGKLMLGSAAIAIGNEYITVGERKYHSTPGLKHLLFNKDLDINLVTNDDLQHYKSMLLDTNAHRRDFDPSKPIKSNKGQKYLQVIKPLFKLHSQINNQSKGKGLSLTKVWKKNTDFVYWDDPNELVNRLKLLIASRDAGNTGLDNEIISIIEELRESKIINK